MKFVFFGLVGFLVVAATAYLWLVPFNEIAETVRVGYTVVVDNLNGALSLAEPKMSSPDSEERPAPTEIDESRIPYPRPRRRSASGRGAEVSSGVAASDVVILTNESANDEPSPALRATTIQSGSVQQTEIYVDTSGKKTMVRATDGKVIEELSVPEK